MFVSVIIPAYNRGRVLINALESLMQQDYDKSGFEVVVINNNSTDNTDELVRAFVEQTRGQMNIKYSLEKRQGDIYARHTGAALAEGEILAFTDDDATFDPNWISEITRMFNEHPKMGALGTNIIIAWDEEPETWVKSFEHFLGKIQYDGEPFVRDCGLYINNGALAIRKDAFFKVGGNNPGQVGSYLIGDAEVGLCRKLHNAGVPIGFTNKTTMWHHQIASVNGTIKDIKRRAVNNGISKAYTDVAFEDDGNKLNLLKSIVLQSVLIVKDLLTNNQIKYLKAKMQLIEDKSHLRWLKKIKTDPVLIEMQKNRDWFLDENYEPSELRIDSRYGSI